MAKVRVHELAKELGIASKDLLATLKENGEFVKSASSSIEAPVVRRAREYYEKHPELLPQNTAAKSGRKERLHQPSNVKQHRKKLYLKQWLPSLLRKSQL
ncbi:translation initiation factor IF-2 N-terminal domain-containing protein [Arcanobacterium hippocoleae]